MSPRLADGEWRVEAELEDDPETDLSVIFSAFLTWVCVGIREGAAFHPANHDSIISG